MRCASPPESVEASRSSVRYSRPTSTQKACRRSRISKQHLVGDGRLLGREFERVEEDRRVFYRECADFGKRPAADAHVARLLPQTPAAAIGAERVAAILREKDADVKFVLLRLKPLEEAAHARPTALALDDGALLLRGAVRRKARRRNASRLCRSVATPCAPIRAAASSTARPRLRRARACGFGMTRSRSRPMVLPKP